MNHCSDNLDYKNDDALEIVSLLQQEELMVSSEKKFIEDLNTQIASEITELLQAAWINSKQRINLHSLIVGRPDCSALHCCKYTHNLNNTVFKKAKDVFDYQVMLAISDLMRLLYDNHEQLAAFLVNGERIVEDNKEFLDLLHSLLFGLSSCFVLPEDKYFVLSLLEEVAKLQLVNNDNPRKLLQQGNCTFTTLYRLFHDGLPSARLFLVACLKNPIVNLIATVDECLDVDFNKVLNGLSAEEKLRKFGVENTPEYDCLLLEYRKEQISKLVDVTNTFINSLREHLICFPEHLKWLISHIAYVMLKNYTRPLKEVYAVCADLIFTLYICPAIIHPEPYGIYDAPISETTRHNLMQIAQILQILSMSKFESPDRKLMDLYNKFDSGNVSGIIDTLIIKHHDDFERPVEKVNGIYKSHVLFTEEELWNIVNFLQKSYNNSTNDVASNDVNVNSFICHITNANYHLSNTNGSTGSNISFSTDLLSSLTRLNGFCDRFSKNAPKPPKNHHQQQNAKLTLTPKKSSLIDKVTKNATLSANNSVEEQELNTVIIIPIKQERCDIIGILPEYKVLKMNKSIMRDKNGQDGQGEDEECNLMDSSQAVNGMGGASTQEKRIKFSQSNDEGSIGNTSDNLEVISEAASNHSVDSSIEMENEDQNDNLSDMISANVSGRGSPNISGRDTPSSQVIENDDARPSNEIRAPNQPNPPQRMDKQIRSEIDDKFCKFEIKKLLEGDETISIISDTWSTDVLASDSETVDAGDRSDQPPFFAPILEQQPGHSALLDLSETQSESAWSTDVLASDNDDAVSVAPSDDSTSVTRSETVEENGDVTNGRRLSSPTASSGGYQHPLKPYQHNSTLLADFRRLDVATETCKQNANLGDCYEPPTPQQQQHQQQQQRAFEMPDSHKFEENANEVLLSNSSLNSSYSSGSTSSENQKNHQNQNQTQNHNQQKWTISATAASCSRQWTITSADNATCSTPTESTSEYSSALSVNSLIVSPLLANNNHNHNHNHNIRDTVKKASATWGPSSTSALAAASSNKFGKPPNITGAIPKSISFDMGSMEKAVLNAAVSVVDEDVFVQQNQHHQHHQQQQQQHKSKRNASSGFFGKFKMGMGFKGRRGKAFRGGPDDYSLRYEGNAEEDGPVRNKKTNGECVQQETSDEILAKYRTKPPAAEAINISVNTDSKLMEAALPSVDANTFFADTKRKLRLVLSNTNNFHLVLRKSNSKKHLKNDLEAFLQMELAKAMNLRQGSAIARISDVLRCVRLLSLEDCHKVCNGLKEDYSHRLVYSRYLRESKQMLLASKSYLQGLREQIDCERETCQSYFVRACVKMILETFESPLQHFHDEFVKLTLAADEKIVCLNNFLKQLYRAIYNQNVLQEFSETQIEMLKIAIEQSVMTAVYLPALFPNGDGDRDRDKLLHEHLWKLSNVVTPNNKYLQINKIYLNECPWIPAQEALESMAAYHTPRDKVRCVFYCTTSIMDLLSLAQDRGSITADDFTPVLVYVIIKSNPKNLLSTIQYVNSFYCSQLSGEEEYWWTQFCAAVAYTKTMEYSG